MLVLTILEVFLAYMAVSVGLMLTLLISFSLLKTALIVAYFMHLRFENSASHSRSSRLWSSASS